MLNSTRFLNAFISIEDYLRQITRKRGVDEHKSFGQRIGIASRTDPTIKRFRYDLKEFAQLRNAIVHDRAGGEVIAEPNEAAVRAIERVVRLITDPPPIYPLFKREVFVTKAGSPLSKAIRVMGDHDLSKLPVIEKGKCIGLLTSNTITSWLAKGNHPSPSDIDLLDVAVQDLLPYNKHADHYRITPRTTPLCEVVEQFEQYEKRGKRLDAVFISETGERNEKLIGVMTLADLPRALKEIEI